MRQILLLISSLLLLFSTTIVTAEEGNKKEVDIRPFVEQGASELALSLLGAYAPDDENNGESRWQWYQQRITIAQYNHEWTTVLELIHRVLAFDNLTTEQLANLHKARAGAFFKQSKHDLAREALLALLWGPDLPIELIPKARLDIIRAYIGEGRFADADSAMRRYELDYPSQLNSSAWLNTKAQQLLAKKDSQQALAVLSRSDGAESRLLRFIAEHSSATNSVTQLAELKDLASWLSDASVSGEVRQLFFSVLFRSNLLTTAPVPGRAEWLEYLFNHDLVRDADSQSLGEALWKAYADYGKWVANQHQLLMGSYESWFETAEKISSKQPLQARALFAWLALNTEAEFSYRAHEKLGENIGAGDGAFQILAALYLSSEQFKGGSLAPVSVRYRLLDQALTVGQQSLAVTLLNGLPRPADAVGLVDWQLRRARVQVLGGTPEYGAKLLENLTKSGLNFSRFQLEAYLAVYYELYGLGQTQLAYSVLEALLPQLESKALKRQVTVWMADIQFERQDFVLSSQLYLRALWLSDSSANDWATLISQRAAKALGRAGFNADARQLYKKLMSNESDLQAKQLFKHELRQLEFIKKAAL